MTHFESPGATELHHRLDERIRAWKITVERFLETDRAVLVFGRRLQEAVVLKVVRHPGDEWASGDVLAAFAGNGVVRALDHVGGAVLLERLDPATPLGRMALNEDDDRATAVLAEVINRMAPRSPVSRVPSVGAWALSFDRYLAGGDHHVSRSLVESARRVYLQLCASQSAPRLLHGDLHHDNVVLDADRGWVAIDPKGVVGELEYEVGAALRNPCARPGLFAEPAIIERRVARFSRALQRDAGRMLGWAFAQAVLATIWELEDDRILEAGKGWIALAQAIRPMLAGVVDA